MRTWAWLGFWLVGCGGEATLEDDDLGGPSGSSSSGSSQPASCSNGRLDPGESDVDCGGMCSTLCAPGSACTGAEDCDRVACVEGTCAEPNATDGLQNGDESDVDCGGGSTQAPRCAVGQSCNSGPDCASRGCYQGRCIEAPSCAVEAGGHTCGSGEVGTAEAQHENCCTSLEVEGFADPDHPGQRVLLDKYEITAGRVREFVRYVREERGGPDVRGWITDNRPEFWNDGWTYALPAEDVSTTDWGFNYTFGSIAGDNADYASGFYVHGQNCAVGVGRPGYPTYWHPDSITVDVLQGLSRPYDQATLDAKSINCIPNAVLAAFCAWDGGQIATREVLTAVASQSNVRPFPQGQQYQFPSYNITLDADLGVATYQFPSPMVETDNAARVAPPGRFPTDAVGSGAAQWMDVVGNLSELVYDRAAERFDVAYYGLGYQSVRAQRNDRNFAQASYKAAGVGGRCMRFR